MADTAYFILSSARDDVTDAKLLSYSGGLKAGKMILTLKVEVSGWGMHRAVEHLEVIQRAHNAKAAAAKSTPAPRKKAIGKTSVLALPAPDLGDL